MTSAGFRERLARRIGARVFYGWTMLGVAAFGMFASGPGQSHTFGVFVGPIADDLGLSHTAVSSAYAGATLVAAFGLPLMGRLVDRFGVRTMLSVVVVALALSAFGFARVTNVVGLAIGFAALRFLGQGSMLLNCANLVSQWFSRKRGFALSLMSLGFSASIAVHPPLAQWLTEAVGWREAWIWLGALTCALMLPLVLVLVHRRPEDLGLSPDGVEAPPGSAGDEGYVQRAEAGLTLGEAMRTSAFWIVAVGLSSLSMLVTGLFFYQVSIFETHGLDAAVAARMFPVTAVTMICAMPAFGYLLDRVRTERMFALALLTMSASMLVLVAVENVALALVYAVVFGINNAAIHSHISYLWPRYFGRRHLGAIQGTGQTFGVVGASLGPLPFGIAFDLTGSYTIALAGLAVLPFACAALALAIRPPRLEA